MKALLLDDDVLRGRAVVRQLKARGYDVLWQKTAAETYDSLSNSIVIGRFDLAVLDYNLGTAETGLDVACYIVAMAPSARPVRVEVHSNDDRGADLMVKTLTMAGVPAERTGLL